MNFRVCFDNEEFRFRTTLNGEVESVEPATFKPAFFSNPVTDVPIVRLFAYGKDFVTVIAMRKNFWIFNGRYFRTTEGMPFRKVSLLHGSPASLYCVLDGKFESDFLCETPNSEVRDPSIERRITEELNLAFGIETERWFEYVFGTDGLEEKHQSWWFTKRLDRLVRSSVDQAPNNIYVYMATHPDKLSDMLLREEPILPTPPTGKGLSPIDAYNLPLCFVTHIPVGELTWREFLHRSRSLELWVGESWDCPSKESDPHVLSFWRIACELVDCARYISLE
jgi:hypothetical protein